jgi:hypothetical protein
LSTVFGVATPAVACDDRPPELELGRSAEQVVANDSLMVGGIPQAAEVRVDVRPLLDDLSLASIRPGSAVTSRHDGRTRSRVNRPVTWSSPSIGEMTKAAVNT